MSISVWTKLAGEEIELFDVPDEASDDEERARLDRPPMARGIVRGHHEYEGFTEFEFDGRVPNETLAYRVSRYLVRFPRTGKIFKVTPLPRR